MSSFIFDSELSHSLDLRLQFYLIIVFLNFFLFLLGRFFLFFFIFLLFLLFLFLIRLLLDIR